MNKRNKLLKNAMIEEGDIPSLMNLLEDTQMQDAAAAAEGQPMLGVASYMHDPKGAGIADFMHMLSKVLLNSRAGAEKKKNKSRQLKYLAKVLANKEAKRQAMEEGGREEAQMRRAMMEAKLSNEKNKYAHEREMEERRTMQHQRDEKRREKLKLKQLAQQRANKATGIYSKYFDDPIELDLFRRAIENGDTDFLKDLKPKKKSNISMRLPLIGNIGGSNKVTYKFNNPKRLLRHEE